MSKKIYLCTNNFYTLFGTVSGYPAGAALCHKPVVCGKDGLNSRHRMGRHKKTAVALIDYGFCFLDVRDNDRNGYERPGTQFERIACQVAQKWKKQLFVRTIMYYLKNRLGGKKR